MAAEQSKAAKRRFADGAFHLRYFAGHGLDVGGKPDPLGRYVGAFARLLSCRTWDLEDGDAQFLAGVPHASLDFVHSSHCLEHLRDPQEGLSGWCGRADTSSSPCRTRTCTSGAADRDGTTPTTSGRSACTSGPVGRPSR